MHPATLPEPVQASLRARFGRLVRFNRLAPHRSALVVIDMQRVFCAPGALLEVPMARAIVPAINRMADALRSLGGTIAWVRSSFPPSDRDWTVMFEAVNPPERGAAIRAALQPGAEGWHFWDGIVPASEDLVLEKDRFSAFFPGACALPELLRQRGIDTVLIAGTMTNVCCESSARDAMMDNFQVVMLADALAARSDAEHLASLATLAWSFGDVQTVDQALLHLAAGAGANTLSKP